MKLNRLYDALEQFKNARKINRQILKNSKQEENLDTALICNGMGYL